MSYGGTPYNKMVISQYVVDVANGTQKDLTQASNPGLNKTITRLQTTTLRMNEVRAFYSLRHGCYKIPVGNLKNINANKLRLVITSKMFIFMTLES